MTFAIIVVVIGVLMIIIGAYYGIKEQNWAWLLSIIVGTLLVAVFATVEGRETARQEFMNKLAKEVDLRQVPVKGDVRFKFSGNIVFSEGKLNNVSLIEKTTVPDPFPVVKKE